MYVLHESKVAAKLSNCVKFMSYINWKLREVLLRNATRIVHEEGRLAGSPLTLKEGYMYFKFFHLLASYMFTILFSFFPFTKLLLKFFPQFFNNKPIWLVVDDL